MDRRNGPTEAWGQAVGFWFRLWQAQIDHSMKFWGLWAQAVPRPSAAELAAEADAMRNGGAERKPAPRKGAAPRAASPKTPKPQATVH